MNHLATVAVENHTCIASLHWRYGFNMPEFYDKLLDPYFMKVWSLQVFRYLVPKGMLLRTKLHGLGRFVKRPCYLNRHHRVLINFNEIEV